MGSAHGVALTPQPAKLPITPFYVACANGHVEVVKLMLKDEEGRIDPNISCGGEGVEFVRCLFETNCFKR